MRSLNLVVTVIPTDGKSADFIASRMARGPAKIVLGHSALELNVVSLKREDGLPLGVEAEFEAALTEMFPGDTVIDPLMHDVAWSMYQLGLKREKGNG